MTNTPQRDDDASLSGSSDDEATLCLPDGEGWEDMEPDVEAVKAICLVCSTAFGEIRSMLDHCRDAHGLDLGQVVGNLDLDFFGTVKLINYIRSKTKAGIKTLDLSTKNVFDDEQYLLPVLEDDALLYSLHDDLGVYLDFDSVNEPISDEHVAFLNGISTDLWEVVAGSSNALNLTEQEAEPIVLRLKELTRKIDRKYEFQNQLYTQVIQDLKLQLEAQETRLASMRSIAEDVGRPLDTENTGLDEQQTDQKVRSDAVDSSYFASYSGHDIHETMLKDTVRTDAYRDFIYENKHLFEGKIVLDVGCGTGILSMFCARAGAAKVIAVDNSEIINSARENVYKNGMGETITCLRGKIEEVVLPVQKVDIVVSEWMGYCLLYEAMLDSVLWARDRYLKPNGLMVPSHCTLRIAPMSDSEYIDEHIHHWTNVYGFDMSSMCHNIYDDAMVQQVPSKAIAADSSPFKLLPLKTVTPNELSFVHNPFQFYLRNDMASLDGFVIWFDTFFLKSPNMEISAHLKAEDSSHNDKVSVAFTTGPFGKDTHWHQTVLLINHHGKEPEVLKKGQVISGTIGYNKRKNDSRALDINLTWESKRQDMKGKQSWSMR